MEGDPQSGSWGSGSRKTRGRRSHKWKTCRIEPARHGPPEPFALEWVKDFIKVDKSKIKFDIYRPIEWQNEPTSHGRRPDLKKILQGRAETEGQLKIDALWLEAWDEEARFWPEEQARAFCNFALKPFSPSALRRVINNFYWYKEAVFHSAECIFFVHGWLAVKCHGRGTFRATSWFDLWATMYNINALCRRKDRRWQAAIAGFYEPLTQTNHQITFMDHHRRSVSSDSAASLATAHERQNVHHLEGPSNECPSINSSWIDTITKQAWHMMTDKAYSLIADRKHCQRNREPFSEADYKVTVAQKKAEVERLIREIEDLEKRPDAEADASLAREFSELVNKMRCGEAIDEDRLQILYDFVEQEKGDGDPVC